MEDPMLNTETKKKRGRPKGSKNKPKVKKDPITKEIVDDRVPTKEEILADAPEDAEAAQAARAILKAAESKASEIVAQREADVAGASPETDPSTDPGQADFVPGTRPPDMLYLPERVYDEFKQVSRPCARKNEYHYCFVEASKVTQFKILGYRFCLYDGGQNSGLAPGGFSGTNMFERTLDGKLRHGDTFLMYIPLRGYEQLQSEERKKIEDWNRAAQTSLHNEGYRRGIRTFEEVDGVQVYN